MGNNTIIFHTIFTFYYTMITYLYNLILIVYRILLNIAAPYSTRSAHSPTRFRRWDILYTVYRAQTVRLRGFHSRASRFTSVIRFTANVQIITLEKKNPMRLFDRDSRKSVRRGAESSGRESTNPEIGDIPGKERKKERKRERISRNAKTYI